MSRRINVSALAGELGSKPFRLVLGLGFDQRSTRVLEAMLPAASCCEVLALMNIGWDTLNSSSVEYYRNKVGTKGELIGDGCVDILQLADSLSEKIASFDKSIKTIVDVTSMSHELLSILIAILHIQGHLDGIQLCYTGAEKYSFNTSESEMWLSKGVSSIRSVLGYPGEQLPSKPLHLVIPVGFEVERAIEIITAYEPAALSLGVGRRDQSVSPAHYEANLNFFNRLEDFVSEQERSCATLAKFTFSCIDPLETKHDIANHLLQFPDFNTIICPLNTKISTVGIALLCIEHPAVQLCYAQPMEYNTQGYATASDWITVAEI
jgi:hypothetical protein